MHKESLKNFVLNYLTKVDKRDLNDYTHSVFYFKDQELYHSSTDTPIALFYEKKSALINLSDSRTEKDINMLTQAIENDIQIVQINSNSLMEAIVKVLRKLPRPAPHDIIWTRGETQYLLASAIKELVRWSLKNYESFQERLKDSYRIPLATLIDFEESMTLFHAGEKIAVLLECSDYYHKFIPPEFYDISIIKLSEDSKIYKDTLYRISEKQNKRIEFFESIFRRRYYFSFYHHHLFPKVLLRMDPKYTGRIVSSTHLEFFISDFKEAFPRILEAQKKAQQNEYDEDFRIGLNISTVYKNGDILISGILIKWEEIERMAKEVGLI